MSAMRTLAGGLDHPESLAWDPGGYLIAGGEAGQIYRVDVANGSARIVANTGGWPLGIALDGEGAAYVCDCKRGEVLRVGLEDGSVSVYSNGTNALRMRVPNDLVFDATGRLYVSDSGRWGANDAVLFVVEPGGQTRVGSDAPLGYANGLALDAMGMYLYMVESSLPGVSRFPVSTQGELGERELVLRIPRVVPDGIALTADGRLIVSCYRPDTVFISDGKTYAPLVDDWTGISLCSPTNVAFFGDNLDRLAVANLGKDFLTEVEVGLRGAVVARPILRAATRTRPEGHG